MVVTKVGIGKGHIRVLFKGDIGLGYGKIRVR